MHVPGDASRSRRRNRRFAFGNRAFAPENESGNTLSSMSGTPRPVLQDRSNVTIRRARCSLGIATSTHFSNHSVITARTVATIPRTNWPPPRQKPITVTSHSEPVMRSPFLTMVPVLDEPHAGRDAEWKAHEIHYAALELLYIPELLSQPSTVAIDRRTPDSHEFVRSSPQSARFRSLHACQQ